MTSLFFVSLISIVTVPFTTGFVMYFKTRFCDSYRRLPLLYKTDTSMIAVTNVMSVVLSVLWAYKVSLSYVLAFDFLAGLPFERWLLSVVFRDNTGPYHGGGALARSNLKRRYKVSVALSCLIRTACAATTCSAQLRPPGTTFSWVQTVALLNLYAVMRTILTDRVEAWNDVVSAGEEPTNNFVITDEEEDAINHDEPITSPVCPPDGTS